MEENEKINKTAVNGDNNHGGKKYPKLIAAIVAITGMSALSVIGAKKLYDSFFKRYERPDYAVTAGLYNYELLRTTLPREEVSFYSGDAKLKGYYYTAKDSKGLVVLVHGIHAGADDYLPIVEYLIQNKYNVFSFDWTGTYDSEGKSTIGMCQAVVDLDNALKHVKSEERFSSQPLFLLGHSCGGYAVTSILSVHDGIKACASISGVNNCYKIILEKGKQYGGTLASEGAPRVFLDAYQAMLFGDYIKLNAVKGINESGIPVFVAHGENDKTISFNSQSIICHRAEITNPNVEYYVGTGATDGHDSVWHSARSAAYRIEVDKAAAKIKDYKEKVEFYKTVDNRLYSEINYELLDRIIAMYNNSL